MKNIIFCSGLYNDIDALTTLVNGMMFEDAILGKEVLNFHYIPAMLDDFFTKINSEPSINFEIQENTGVFRKPDDIIHFENFYEHSIWTVIVALEDTIISLYKHKESSVATFFDVKDDVAKFATDNARNVDAWDPTMKINMKKNDFIFIRPWMWHSLEKDKLVQVFMLNQKLEPKE